MHIKVLFFTKMCVYGFLYEVDTSYTEVDKTYQKPTLNSDSGLKSGGGHV